MGDRPRPGDPRPDGGARLTPPARAAGLRAQAAQHGIQSSHLDGFRRRRRVPDATIAAILEAMGVSTDRTVDPERTPPVVVAWAGNETSVALRARRPVLALEDGTERPLSVAGGTVRLPGDLPLGYHRLRHGTEQTLVISAPRQAYQERRRGWGLFAPIHWLRSDRSWGTGDFTDLGELATWAEGLGGETVATLPPLAAFLDRPLEPSPYAPVSRRFWNELFVDITKVPDLAGNAEARRLVARAGRAIRVLEAEPLVDHRRAMALKRTVLERMAADLPDTRRRELERFVRTRPGLRNYARFRAACEARGTAWTDWPTRALPRDLDPAAVRYHEYAQWLAETQLAELGARHRLLLDLPLGVHPGGFDTWEQPDLFAHGVSAGAPPDAFSDRGQTWGFPPIHPARSREQGHAHVIACVRHLFAHAAVLRVDHVMGLHRLYWVPEGTPATDGAYVSYPWEELSAILCLESHRRGAEIVGEDLGTLPRGIRPAMRRRGFLRTYVTQTELFPDRDPPIAPIPSASLATVNTHDMPTFRAFWEGSDIRLRRRLGLLDADGARDEERLRERRRRLLVRELAGTHRGRTARDVYRAEAVRLASSPARLAVLSLGDLLGERGAQNLPGTGEEHPNWRRRAERSLEEAARSRSVLDTLRTVNRMRRGEEHA